MFSDHHRAQLNRTYLRELNEVSGAISAWARRLLEDGATISQVRAKLRELADK